MNFDKTYGSIHDVQNNINNHGSGFLKQKRSDPEPHPPDDLHHGKSSRTDYFDQPNTTMSLRSDSLLSNFANDTNNMLSFSSSAKDGNGNQTPFFSFYQPSPVSIKNTGYGYGGLPTGTHIPVSRYKGPFTPSQWMELEHQALIYKHFVANVPVPSQLLAPLRKSISPFIFPGPSSSTSYAPNSYGWGSFHLGFPGNTDPEPGRCRRTDGKKWRCSRDAVPDQKYCERHINRGRHRSRKPVEGHNGHVVSGPTAAKAGPMPAATTIRTTTTAVSSAAFSRRDPAIAVPPQTPIGRSQESQVFAVMKESSDSLMHPINYTDHGASNPNPLPHFVDQWSKHESLKEDWTQLSMSIPMTTSDFSSSSYSPAQETLTLSLASELDFDPTHKDASNWIPISRGNSTCGPLGEVLNRNDKTPSYGLETNSLNQMTEMWDAGHYQIGSSPTGVLQKKSFVSLSNSSSGSSLKGNKKDEDGGSGSGSFFDELLLL